MEWNTALAAACRVEARGGLAACQLSYRYLNGGPTLLAEREQTLRLIVASLPEGVEMPGDVGQHLVAWARATAMTRRRPPWDLPPAWSAADSASG